jgi:hypothetical protein
LAKKLRSVTKPWLANDVLRNVRHTYVAMKTLFHFVIVAQCVDLFATK